MSETAEDRAKRLIEWRKKHGKNRLVEKTPVAKSGRYKTRLRPRAVRAKKQTPCKRGRDENDCTSNSNKKTVMRSKIPTPRKRVRREANHPPALDTLTDTTVDDAARNAFTMSETEITALLRKRCRGKKWELKKTVNTQKEMIKKLKRGLKNIFDEKKTFVETCSSIEGNLLQKCDELMLRTTNAENERTLLKQSLNDLKKDQAEKTKEIKTLQAARAKSESLENELKEKLATKQAELTVLQAQEDSHVAHIKKIETSLETANTLLAKLQKEFEKQKNKYLASLQEAEKDLNAKLQATKAEAKQVQEQLQTQLTEQTQEKETAQHRVRDLTEKVSSLENECKTKELELTTLRVQVAHSKESVERMQHEHDATKAQLKAKEEQLASALESFSKNQQSHQTRVDQMMEVRSKLEDNIRTQRCAKERLDAEINTLKQTLSVSETKLADTQSRLSESEQQLSEQTAKAAELQQLLEGAKQSLADTVAELKETKAAFEHATVQWKQQTESDKQAWNVAKNHLEEMLRTRSTDLETTKSTLQETQKQLETSKSETSELEVQLREKKIEVNTMKDNMGVSYKAQMAKLVEMASENKSLSRQLDNQGMLQTSYDGLRLKMRDMERQLLENEIVRRKLHNRIQELRGNIRVFVRVRPFLPSDGVDDVSAQPIKFAADAQSLKVVPGGDAPVHKFKFDKTFGLQSKQSEVFEEVSELVQSALDGHNVCIFSYGQTGSGKTYTMQGVGSGEEEGLIPRSIKQILTTARKLRAQGWEFHLDASFLEIYNEKINDLLSTFSGAVCPDAAKSNRAGYDVKKNRGGETYVSNLKYFRVNEMYEVERLINHATKKRSVGCTAMNSQSSRSHSVFSLRVTGINKLETKQLRGALHLCDLAGSERLARSQAKGAALKETQNINKSLSFLTNVFMQIKAKSKHISFRDSKLTYLLESCFSKNGKTMMLVNVSPTLESTQESLCSLKFATQVNQVELGKAKAKVQQLSSTPSTGRKPGTGRKPSTGRKPKTTPAKNLKVKRGGRRKPVSSMRTSKRMKR